MSFNLFDAPRTEASARVGFSGNTIERLSEKRSEERVLAALDDPRAKTLLVAPGRLVMKKPAPDGYADPWFLITERELDAERRQELVLLGYAEDKTPLFAVSHDGSDEELDDALFLLDYRSIYVQGLLSDSDLGALAQGAALVSWHRTHRFCSRCGHESQLTDGGYKRVCPSCNALHFPRTDPVVIMLTVTPDGEKVLLGRSPSFAPGVYSCLAGFVEPGETLENAVRRETLEESGIEVGRVAYHSSQPWPFPHTLMIGCLCEALSTEIRLDDELEDARWFNYQEVKAIQDESHPDGILLPPLGAIARLLIEDWITHKESQREPFRATGSD